LGHPAYFDAVDRLFMQFKAVEFQQRVFVIPDMILHYIMWPEKQIVVLVSERTPVRTVQT